MPHARRALSGSGVCGAVKFRGGLHCTLCRHNGREINGTYSRAVRLLHSWRVTALRIWRGWLIRRALLWRRIVVCVLPVARRIVSAVLRLRLLRVLRARISIAISLRVLLRILLIRSAVWRVSRILRSIRAVRRLLLIRCAAVHCPVHFLRVRKKIIFCDSVHSKRAQFEIFIIKRACGKHVRPNVDHREMNTQSSIHGIKLRSSTNSSVRLPFTIFLLRLIACHGESSGYSAMISKAK